MKIVCLETIQLRDFPNMIWVHLYTDAGVVGLGETFRGPDAVASQLHEHVAPYLLGKDPLRIDQINHHLLNSFIGSASTGVETRAASAVDIALWDIFGQATGQPLHQLLGGLSRDHVPVYNTCAGYTYNNRAPTRRLVDPDFRDNAQGPYDDQVAFTYAADELACSLLEEGYGAMKIWPFDPFAERSKGAFISAADLKRGLEPFEKIRRAVGNRIEVMCEFHSFWDLPTAKRIARALEPYNPYWSEDPIKASDIDGLREYAAATRIPVCGSETLGPRRAFRDLLNARAVDIVMIDVGWCGGLGEAKKIATMAEAYQRPVAPHDCVGPVVLVASVHLALNAPNTLYQEVVRAYISGWYQEIVTELPRVANGVAYPMTGAGLGTRLQPDISARDNAVVRRTPLV